MKTPQGNTDLEGRYQALLLVSFGGPEKQADVLPFLENVTRGRDVPPDRLATVASHYDRFGGKSPINDLNRKLIEALESELTKRRIRLPVYWGNRNWTPYLSDTVAEMASDGVQRALAIVTSAYSGYSSCRQYLNDIAAAVHACDADIAIDKVRPYWNHPGFIEANAANLRRSLDSLVPSQRSSARILFTAHSIPTSMSATSDYELQLRDAARLVMTSLLGSDDVTDAGFDLAFQSRSGPPRVAWLEPDVGDALASMRDEGIDTVVVVPIGFISDHMEVVYDLDVEARELAEGLGLTMLRAATAGTHPLFVSGLVDLVEENLDPKRVAVSLGDMGPRPTRCEPDCCPSPARS